MIFYVATDGNDHAPGNIHAPWRTWQKAFNTAAAGDIVYIRGGTYNAVQTLFLGIYCGVIQSTTNSGTSASHITISNYPNETPILNCSGFTGVAARFGIYMRNVNYWDLVGLTVANVPTNSPSTLGRGWMLNTCSNITFTRCNVHNCGDGFSTTGFCDYVYWTNCDSYDNDSSLYDGGDFANGWTTSGYGSGGNFHYFFEGCRAWHNSDDGYDFVNADGNSKGGYITMNKCWAFRNGFGVSGNGVGFKLGCYTDASSDGGIQRTITNCMSWLNTGAGFDEAGISDQRVNCILYNNTAYRNDSALVGYRGFHFGNPFLTAVHILRNNLGYDNYEGDYYGAANVTHDHNSWDSAVTVTDDDFISLDDTGTDAARNYYGFLPVLDFLKLKTGSDLIGAGVDVGLTSDCAGHLWYHPPSIGAYEFSSYVPPLPIPVTSITVSGTGGLDYINTDDGTLQMLAAVLPADATDPTYTWSVIAGTGTATITSGGLLTAVTNGTVTVRATANDGSGIFGELIVTLSYQLPPAAPTHNIAPAGWHVPTSAELWTLALYLDPGAICSVNIAGGMMKEAGGTYWNLPNVDATNSSGFNGKGSGYRDSTGAFASLKDFLLLWNADEYDANSGNTSQLYSGDNNFTTSTPPGCLNANPKKYGQSIRLIKDDSIDPGSFTDYDGNIYPTVKIGTQVWMAANLKVTHFADGTLIPLITDDAAWAAATTAAMCWYNNIPE